MLPGLPSGAGVVQVSIPQRHLDSVRLAMVSFEDEKNKITKGEEEEEEEEEKETGNKEKKTRQKPQLRLRVL